MTEIRSQSTGRAGIVVLDRPAALNALTLPMISDLARTLAAFAADPAVERVVLRSASPRAFSAGGDIRRIRDLVVSGDFEGAHAFFAEEFALDLAISRFAKPYISLIDGLCFGGGIGISVHGRFRIVTENAVFSMPEIVLGYYPDIGGSYFLPRLPGAIGTWLALTGERVTGGDAVHAGLATHFVPASRLGDLDAALAQDSGEVEAILDRFAEPAPHAALGEHRARIDRLFGSTDLHTILERLARDDTPFARRALSQVEAASPHSLAVTLASLEAGRTETLEQCLARELALADVMVRHPDFVEGVRAALVDKDRTPRWQSDLPEHSAALRIARGTGAR